MKKDVLTMLALVCMVTASAALPEKERLDTLKATRLNEVVVKGVRVQKDAPFAVVNIDKTELQNFSTAAKELPFLFSRTPGVVAWSENGVGTGTTSMRIRGAGASRINVTLDGVSLNSPEDQAVFWVNMNSFSSILGSAQLQRGVGTSTNGDGAFGGSISLSTAVPSFKPALELTASYGSYNTYNTGLNFSTGLLGEHIVFDGAYHETATDGFIHGTRGRSGSYYGGLTWFDDKFQIRYKNIGSFEKTGQAWNGVVAGNDDASLMDAGIRTYKDMYEHGLGRFNPLYEQIVFDEDKWEFPTDANGNYMTQRYKLRDGRYWDRTTDNFYYNHNILSATWQPSNRWSHNIALHYTYGRGYYKEFKPNAKFAKFGLVYYDEESNFVKRSDFVRKKGLTQHFYGLTYNVNYTKDNWDIIGGLYLQQFRGDHWGYLTYIADKRAEEMFFGNNGSYKYYDSDARKDDYSGYIKGNYRLADCWSVFADIQFRHVRYETTGVNDVFIEQEDGTYKNQVLDINANYNFFNPKAGISFAKDGHKAYVSLAYSNREPERNNFTDNGNYPYPNQEKLFDVEFGYQYKGSNWHAGANFYYMDYIDQLVQTGQVSDIGEALTTNIKDSYRMGVEVSAGWQPLAWLSVEGNAAISKNKVKDFDEYVDNWDGDLLKVHYDNSTLAFSPSTILNGFIDIHHKNFQATWHTNFVSRQYLDNSENKNRSLPCYSQTNISLSYKLGMAKIIKGMKEIVFGVDFNNIFNRHYASSGWVYSAVSESSGYTNDNRYYQIGFIPMAGFTAMGHITLRF